MTVVAQQSTSRVQLFVCFWLRGPLIAVIKDPVLLPKSIRLHIYFLQTVDSSFILLTVRDILANKLTEKSAYVRGHTQTCMHAITLRNTV